MSKTILLNHSNWHFTKENTGIPTAIMGEAITLPHTWNAVDGQDGGNDYYRGTCWYTLALAKPTIPAGGKAVLQLDGAAMTAAVYLNGEKLAQHKGGYSTFRVDLTDHLQEENLLAISVDNSDNDTVYPQKADFTFYGGLYRDVTLHIVPAEHFALPDNGTPALKVTPIVTDLAAKTAKVTVEAAVVGAQSVTFALEGQALTAPVENGTATAVFTLDHAHLWDGIDDPFLYTVSAKLDNGEEASARFGCRKFEIDPQKGFFLNGKETKFKGVCVHHDGGCLGAAMYREVWLRRLLKLKEGGCNAIRCSHNPHMPELYDLCDELGLLMMDEAFDEWENPKNKWSTGHNVYPPKHEGYAEDFPEWHERDLADMVRRDRNHPSIVMWSIGNEIDYPNDPYCHPLFETMTGNNDANKPAKERQYDPNKPNAERLSAIAKELAAIVRTQDTTRPVTLAAAFPELSSHIGFFDALDVVGYNYKEHLYEESHCDFPSLPFLGSENGGGYEQWCAVRDNAYISGQFLWTGIDYLGEAHGWPIHGSSAGLMDLAGFEKPGFYRRKAFWSTEPFACILTRPDDGDEHEWRPWNAHWNYTDGENVVVRVFTNVQKETISLSIVGNDGEKSLHDGTYLEKEGCTEWRFAYEPGVLKAVCGEAECSIQTAGKAVELSANVWHAEETINKEEVMQIEVSLTDENGVLAAEDLEITAEVIGGTLLGLENGDLADLTPYCEAHRKTHNGRLIVYVKPKEDVKVCISCPELDKRVWIEQ